MPIFWHKGLGLVFGGFGFFVKTSEIGNQDTAAPILPELVS